DQLPAIAQSRDDLVKRRGIIDELNLDPNRKVVTFFSQPLSLKGSFPYNEFEVLDLIVSALQPLEDTFQLVVKDHPRAATLAEPHVSYGLYTAEYPADDLFVVSDVVLGMSTTQLMYAALLGIPSFSIQPGQGSETDCNLLTRLKRTPVIQSDLELRNYLGALDSFTHPKIEELTKYCDGKSCYRIERLMREVLKADYE
ncbi:MAG: hypothetical protein KDD62_14215, partial [Bdellovibrionales bacterium]|nr:hypothetical protein [Bdellovibrionales bacterium]